ncbi:MAG: transcriptional activator [Rhodospirillaceae bacterium]|nr:MAG: transcriptional activator [Rhodospirillaceae bacterium]
MAAFIALFARQPWHGEWQHWIALVGHMADASTDAHLRAYARSILAVSYYYRGRLDGSQRLLDQVRREDTAGLMNPLPQVFHPFIVADHALCTGAYAEGLEATHATLAAAEKTGIAVWETTTLFHGVMLCLATHDRTGARAFLDRLAPLLDEGRPVNASGWYAARAWHDLMTGNHADAVRHGARMLSRLERAGVPLYQALALTGHAFILQQAGRAAEAEATLMCTLFASHGILYGSRHIMNRGGVGESQPSPPSCVHHAAGEALLREAMAFGARHGYRAFIFWPREAMATLCARALALEIEPGYVRALIAHHRFSPPPEATDAWPWPLRIHVLGRFRLWRDGEEVSFPRKVPKVPLRLLKALVAFGAKDVAEEKLIDALWPESEGDAARQVLATTLFALRKLIGADVLHRQNGRLFLDPGPCWVDLWAVTRALDDADLSPEDFPGAITRLYTGGAPVCPAACQPPSAGPPLDQTDRAPEATRLRQWGRMVGVGETAKNISASLTLSDF